MHTERDSRKDEAVVFIFIFATGGLLAWALFKPWIERYIEVSHSWITLDRTDSDVCPPSRLRGNADRIYQSRRRISCGN